MKSPVVRILEQLNQVGLHADAWLLWRALDGGFKLVASGGLGGQASQEMVASWAGNEDLLAQAISAKEPARATAAVKVETGDQMSLHLVALPIQNSGQPNGVLQCLFRQESQATAVFRRGLNTEEQSQLAVCLDEQDNVDAAAPGLVDELAEIVSSSSGAARLTALLNEFCLRYQFDRAVLFEGTGARCQLLGQSGSARVEERSADLRELKELGSEYNRSQVGSWQLLEAGRAGAEASVFFTLSEASTAAGPLFLLLQRFGDSEQADSESAVQLERAAWALAFQAALDGTGSSTGARFPARLLMLCGIVVLLVVPIPLVIEAEGQFWPASRANVYAPEDGVIEADQLQLPANGVVEAEQPLLTMTSRELELQLSQLDGQLATVNEQIRSLRNTRPERPFVDDPRQTSDRDVSIRLAELTARQEGLQAERELLQDRLASLTVLSPLGGQILTWDPRLKLSGRPVARGQQLLAIGDTAGDWEVLADIAAEDLQLFKQGMEKRHRAVQLKTLGMGPERYRGQLSELADVLHQTEAGRLAARSEFELIDDLEGVTPGQRVTVQVNAGYYPAGYVWFRHAWEAIRLFFTW
ncbi:HlyD family efflux transporter periplasmic adaptor subunit [Rubinisphaera sp. JC750]|uniref:HlyD family efflux transporter periplasmic adaptor subunit n=1 Tax=Rubinisphaera sp. JC750 TaxID=2898658 RepID=UPI001F18450D|nr:HlyD family efflux transporter periplasmic adaptor subunit [Rubinisphaera sp. JC750]